MIAHTTALATPVVEHWLERKFQLATVVVNVEIDTQKHM